MLYQIKNIYKSFDDLLVLDDISIYFPEHKTTCILGPSGCGKTTLLNIMTGIVEKDFGQVIGFDDKDISFVFQEDRLIEWKNIKDNLAFVLKGKMYKDEIDAVVDNYLKLVNLEEYKYYYPRSLSGGMRQRISILRAFAYPSDLLLMDEPFKSLDINNKKIVIDFFKEVKAKEKRTSIFVTHDVDEAIDLADSIVILSDKATKVKSVINNIKEDKIKAREEIEKGIIAEG
ncbi:MAG TPA: ABC transporter ATP-binding protein [Tissierellaceae bacterium]|nr:ABC transporter ATP-binding protein [Tissierellaceae bacterium]